MTESWSLVVAEVVAPPVEDNVAAKGSTLNENSFLCPTVLTSESISISFSQSYICSYFKEENFFQGYKKINKQGLNLFLKN